MPTAVSAFGPIAELIERPPERLPIRGQERALFVGALPAAHLIAVRERSGERNDVAVARPAFDAASNVGIP